MTLLRRAEGADERMDRPDVDPAELDVALDHIAAVNRWLGARRALISHAAGILSDRSGSESLQVLDVGTGAGDLPLALARWAADARVPLRITAADLHEETLALARTRIRGSPGVRLVRADGLRLPFPDGAFDLALLSMTLHHMDGDALVAVLEELGRVARGGHVLVGELERSLPNYLGARLLAATVWRGNPITRHDGPLSVLRAFTPAELRSLGERAGLRRPAVHRHLFYRLVLRAEA